MGKIEVSALIKAIQESVSLLVSDGIAPRERITDPVNDAARVQDLESGYSTEIDDIVDNIPDVPPTPPAPTLPIVQNIQCWLNQNQGSAAVSDSFNRFAYDESSHRIPYSDSLLYCLFYVYSNQVLDGTFSILESSGSVIISRSNGTNTGTIYYILFATCSDKTSTVTDVFDSQNNAFKSFKFTSEGTDYYYVLDQIQTDWTDDLSSIGYSLEPTVLYAYPQSGGEAGLANAYWSKNSTYTVYDSDGHVMSLNPGYTIMAVYYLYNNTLEKYDDEYAFKFAFSYSDSYLKAYQANSTAYNVAKIEYKDLPTEKAYLDKYSHSANWSFPYNTNTLLYADDGSYIPYDSNKRYVMSCASKADGTLVYAKLTPVNMDGYLGYRVSTTAQACYIYYTMS